MQVTERDIVGIPRNNLRVPVDDFAQVWRAAEELGRQDWYGAGVAVTCRWLATATVRAHSGRWYTAYAPVTNREQRAYPELIEAEFLTAEKLDMESPRPDWLMKRPGWSEAICATLRWAWRRSGSLPLKPTAE